MASNVTPINLLKNEFVFCYGNVTFQLMKINNLALISVSQTNPDLCQVTSEYRSGSMILTSTSRGTLR